MYMLLSSVILRLSVIHCCRTLLSLSNVSFNYSYKNMKICLIREMELIKNCNIFIFSDLLLQINLSLCLSLSTGWSPISLWWGRWSVSVHSVSFSFFCVFCISARVWPRRCHYKVFVCVCDCICLASQAWICRLRYDEVKLYNRQHHRVMTAQTHLCQGHWLYIKNIEFSRKHNKLHKKKGQMSHCQTSKPASSRGCTSHKFHTGGRLTPSLEPIPAP